MATPTSKVPWIDDAPATWQTLTITVEEKPFSFLARWSGGVDTKIDQHKSINASGGKMGSRGSHGLEVTFQLLLWEKARLDDYTTLAPLLLARGVGKKISPVLVDHPIVRLFVVRRGMYVKHVGVPERRSNQEPLTANLRFIEHLPPTEDKKKPAGRLDRTGAEEGPLASFPPVAQSIDPVSRVPADEIPNLTPSGMPAPEVPDEALNLYSDVPGQLR